MQLIKYPRTRHIESSRCQPGDENLESVPFKNISDRYLVVEEKLMVQQVLVFQKIQIMLQSRDILVGVRKTF